MKDQWVIQEIGREIFRNSQNQTKMKAPLISIFEIELWQFSEESYRSEYLHKKNQCGSRYMTKWLIWRAQKQTREAKPQSSEEQEIIKIWAEINDVGTQRTVHKISQTKSCFSGKINKVAKSIAKLTKKKLQENTQINDIRDEKLNVTTESSKIQRIIKKYFEHLNIKEPENLEKGINS